MWIVWIVIFAVPTVPAVPTLPAQMKLTSYVPDFIQKHQSEASVSCFRAHHRRCANTLECFRVSAAT